MKTFALRRRIGAIAMAALGAGAMAAEPTPRTLEVCSPTDWKLNVRSSFHRSAEDRTYTSFEYRRGLGDGWDMAFRGAFAKTGLAKSVAPIRTGGSDWEFQVRRDCPLVKGGMVSGGVSFPSTPAQNSPHLTYAYEYGVPVGEAGASVSLGLRGVSRAHSNIMGVGGAFSVPLSPQLKAFGSFTGITIGKNTIDTTTGRKLTRSLYEVGVSFETASEGANPMGFYFLYGNNCGLTTGASLTPALGNRGSLQIGFTVRGRS